MHELTEEARVAASVDVIWADLTLAPQLAEWIWPPRFDSVAVVELRPLGRWEVRSDTVGIAVVAEVVQLSAPVFLRLLWRWEGEDHATDVEILLEPAADDATRVVVHHRAFLTAEERTSHVEGWSNCLQRLVERHA